MAIDTQVILETLLVPTELATPLRNGEASIIIEDVGVSATAIQLVLNGASVAEFADTHRLVACAIARVGVGFIDIHFAKRIPLRVVNSAWL